MRHTFRLMHLRQLRRQPLRVALAVIAIGAGVSLTVAVLVARSSLDRSFTGYNSAVGGPPHCASSAGTTTVASICRRCRRLSSVDGVEAAVPLVLTVTQISDRRGHDDLVAVVGADCRAEVLFGAHGCDPGSPRPDRRHRSRRWSARRVTCRRRDRMA